MREDFEYLLRTNGYNFRRKGQRTIITHDGTVYLDSLTSLPEGAVFENGGGVSLHGLTSLPEGTVFKNRGDVFKGHLEREGEA